MTDKTIWIFGALGAGVLVYLLYSKKTAAQTTATTAALSNQTANTTAGQVSGILASVGSFFNSGALQSLADSFLNTGDSNQPGLITPSNSANSNSSAENLNTPGLNAQITTGPTQQDDLSSSLDYASLGLD